MPESSLNQCVTEINKVNPIGAGKILFKLFSNQNHTNMKKTLFALLSALVLLLATSCTEEVIQPTQGGDTLKGIAGNIR